VRALTRQKVTRESADPAEENLDFGRVGVVPARVSAGSALAGRALVPGQR